MPSGVTLAANGTLSGTPAFGTAGTYPITITATDANSNTTNQAFTLTVTASAPMFTSGTSTTFAENSAGHFHASPPTGIPPITFGESGPLPSGVTLAPNGTLLGHAGLRHGGDLPDHHHGDRRQLELDQPGLHPHGDGATAPSFTSGTSTTFAENSAGHLHA